MVLGGLTYGFKFFRFEIETLLEYEHLKYENGRTAWRLHLRGSLVSDDQIIREIRISGKAAYWLQWDLGPRMQAAGLQRLKLQTAAASPDPQTQNGAFPENSVTQFLISFNPSLSAYILLFSLVYIYIYIYICIYLYMHLLNLNNKDIVSL